eukprot:NODE_1171_length_1908_cov_0.304035.p3 type:complete len:120 gc:universal NODE_1171_length_1908_cov_0.304035:885-1244(+)
MHESLKLSRIDDCTLRWKLSPNELVLVDISITGVKSGANNSLLNCFANLICFGACFLAMAKKSSSVYSKQSSIVTISKASLSNTSYLLLFLISLNRVAMTSSLGYIKQMKLSTLVSEKR